MALHLQTCGDLSLSHESLWVVLKPSPPWENKKVSTRRKIARAQSNRGSSLRNEPTNEAMWKVPLADRTKERPANFVATRRFSSVLRVGRQRRYEAKMETRDRVLLSIADWVFLRVRDPLVEIDPITVKTVVMKEQEAEGDFPPSSEDETTASTSVPGIYAYLPPGIPRGAKGAALLAGIVLLLAALSTAAILALRGKKRSEALPIELEDRGPAQNGDAREDLNGGSTDVKELIDKNKSFTNTENGDGVIKRSPVVVTTSSQSQSSFHPPAPFTSDLQEPDYSSPHRDAFRGAGTNSHPTSAGKRDLQVHFNVPSKDGSGSLRSETDVTLAEEIISTSNGSTTGKGPVENSITEEIIASVVMEEILTMKKSSERAEASFEEEYVLVGDSESLTTVADHPPSADGGLFKDSLLTEEYATKPISKQNHSPEAMGIISVAAQEGVSEESTLFEDPDSQPSIEEISAEIDEEVVEERRKTYIEVLKKVLPAVSVGAGAAALSTLSGVDGALQMVGLLATASFITRDLIWAGPRKQLVDELCNIKDHKQFIEFLKGRDIIPDELNQ